MGVSQNRGTPNSSILIGFSIINHQFWGTPIFGNTHMGPQKNGNTNCQSREIERPIPVYAGLRIFVPEVLAQDEGKFLMFCLWKDAFA